MKQFKIRSSATGEIMGKLSGGLPDGQKKELDRLIKLKIDNGKVTVKQQETIDAYSIKKDAPKTLPKGCITYLEKWFKGQLYQWRGEIGGDAIDKGNICEDEAISMTIKHFKLPYGEKNEDYFENEYITGTPDLIYKEEIFDTKCSENPDTFPLLVKSDLKTHNATYWWQGQSYMELCGVAKYSVVYALCNTPEKILERQIHYATRNLSKHDAGAKELEMRINNNFDDIPLKYKLKRFEFSYDQFAVEAIYERVRLCRQYIKDVLMESIR